MEETKQYHLTVIGLGYVGLPLAVEFAKKYPVVGFVSSITIVVIELVL